MVSSGEWVSTVVAAGMGRGQYSCGGLSPGDCWQRVQRKNRSRYANFLREQYGRRAGLRDHASATTWIIAQAREVRVTASHPGVSTTKRTLALVSGRAFGRAHGRLQHGAFAG